MIKTVKIKNCSNDNPELCKSSFSGKIPVVLLIALILLEISVTGANAATGFLDIFQPGLFFGDLDIYVKNEAGGYQSGAKVELYTSDREYIENKTTGSSGNVSWTGMKIGTYRYKVYYGSEFWGLGDAFVNTDATTTKNFRKYTPYVYSVAISDRNGIIKTMFAPGENVHVNVTLNNPDLVNYDTRATLRINQKMASSPYTFENTTGPVDTSAGGYAYYEWDWKIPIASGTYYINPLALTNISNNYILTDDAGWGWNFTKTAPSKGYGAWIYGINSSYVKDIANYNLDIERQKCKCLSSNRIIYLFPYTGELNRTTLNLSYHPDRTKFYKENLKKLYVYPMIDSSGSLSGLNRGEIVNLAINITGRLNSDKYADGLQLDIEPYDDSLITLVNEIRNRTDKPISVAIAEPEPSPALFQNVDFTVLMLYGVEQNFTPLTNYSKYANRTAMAFLSSAYNSSGYAMIGVPAKATKNEWEYKINGTTQERTNSNFTMEQYLAAALNATNMARNTSNENNYLGISIWNLKSIPGKTNNNETLFPYIISPAAWNFLKQNMVIPAK